MIRYPILEKGMTVGVTAPSSGVPVELHDLLESASSRMEERGYKVIMGETPWTQDKAKSAPAKERGDEFNNMMADGRIQLMIPPWGGELLLEILEHVDFDKVPEKWILGYSDTSLLLLAITLRTGIATAHGTNLVDLRGAYSDETTAAWEAVLATKKSQSILQESSEKYQKAWRHDKPSPCVFHLTEETEWKIIGRGEIEVEGRLLGGCIDTIRHLIGTPYGDVQSFRDTHIPGDPVVWFFENAELSTTDLRRTLVQMKYAGWFVNCSGILFGRSPANTTVGNYAIEDVYHELAVELQIPVIYDIDCGHVPPQITFINGAYGKIKAANGKGTVLQTFI
ncbi:S66 family peptidase [Mesobacillus subterraneus]|uniref:LD-carboxypeptidase n=1 Tax=Mesobacillus subterraneus TaxID=285983 RepID=A0A3R9FM36_9BACI|nr:S66 peptidase family protein [Mesobacillus subterraneus]RSD29585.1 LD-carboxypeptidase [Mesobacillus subterraneus]